MISAAALAYVFTAVDWPSVIAATERANLPLFVAFTFVDKMIFFLWWGILQAAVVRRFVTPVSTRKVIEVRGGAELLRTLNNPVADAAFLYGIAQLTGGQIAAVVTAAALPFVCHFAILLLQATLSLFFLPGGPVANLDVLAFAVFGWTVFIGVAISTRTGLWQRFVSATRFGRWLAHVNLRSLLGLVGWFALLAAFDILIQGLASRAFGVTIDWWALAGRLPILYTVLSLPSFGNFGTREIAWAACFGEFAPRETLIAYALATNALFLVMHALIGVLFLPRALALISEMRRLRAEGTPIPRPLLHDASDP